MFSNLTQYLGILGNILLVIAYLPQIKKIIVTRKSEDISTLMWFIILLGDVCMLAYAVIQNDPVFIILFTVFIIENLVMLYVAIKFKPKPENISARQDLTLKKEGSEPEAQLKVTIEKNNKENSPDVSTEILSDSEEKPL